MKLLKKYKIYCQKAFYYGIRMAEMFFLIRIAEVRVKHESKHMVWQV